MDIILSQSVECLARIYNKKLASGNIDDEDRLQIEIFLMSGCNEKKMLRSCFIDWCNKCELDRRRHEDPTTQEDDRKSWISRKSKTFASMTGFSAIVRRLVGKLRKYAGTR